jgi:hypothetical protein
MERKRKREKRRENEEGRQTVGGDREMNREGERGEIL